VKKTKSTKIRFLLDAKNIFEAKIFLAITKIRLFFNKKKKSTFLQMDFSLYK